MSKLNDALTLASQGFYVFPLHNPLTTGGCSCGNSDCESTGKHPRVKGWQDRATTDPKQIRAWWQKWPAANIGLALNRSDLLAIDIDPRHGGSVEMLPLAAAELETVTQVTGGGGLHLIYRQPQGVKFGNSDNELAEGINVRGDGGLIVGPGSLHASGTFYAWQPGRSPADLQPLPLPFALGQLLRPKEKETPQARPFVLPPAPVNGDVKPYARAVFDGELQALAAAPVGGRNEQLNRSAFVLGQFVGGGELGESEVETELRRVALSIGLGERETTRTIQSGLSKGKQKPRQIPPPTAPGIPPGNGAAPPAVEKPEATAQLAQPEKPNGKELPSIQTNGRRHRDVSQDAYNAVLTANTPPAVFVRSGLLTRITEDENGRPVVSTMNENDLKHTLERCANFFTRRQTANGVIDTSGGVPIVIVKDVMSYPSYPALPPLVGVVTAPVFSPDGDLVTEPGYNRAAKVFYYQDGIGIGDTSPTPEKVARAKSIIFDDLLIDFKFVDQASLANAVSLILLPFVRPLIPGSCPMYLVDAPTFGTGKSLLIKACAQPFTDHLALMTAPTDQEEWRKRITSTLMSGPSHILVDNLKEALDSSHLAAVLTTTEWSDRVLGASLTVNLPARSIWTATGNNVAVSNELARRLCWIRLDSEVEKPWERAVFKHPNLIGWATDNRSALATAALTLIRKWVSEGMIRSGYRLGSFESWSQIMGGILEAIDIPSFMGNALEMYDRLAADDAPLHTFVKTWWDRHGGDFVTVAELFPLASAYDTGDSTSLNILGELLQQKTEQGRKTGLGRLLRKNEGRIFSGYKIRDAGTYNGAGRYRLQDTGMT